MIKIAKSGSKSLLNIVIGLLLCFLVYQLGFKIVRSDFTTLILFYGIFFLFYLGIFHFATTQKDISFFVGIGIFLRLLLVFALPNFSDDIYRFIWDGRLITQGINPFDHLPSFYMEHHLPIVGIDQALYQQLNSPNYFTIYPPVNQAIFALAAYCAPESIWGSSLVMKSFLFAFETGSIFLIIRLLKHFNLPAKNVLLYALNPLIILEITGNLHFEGAMIFFLLLAIWLIVIKKNWLLSAIAIALSIASKLLPLMLLPFLIRRIGKQTNFIFKTNFSGEEMSYSQLSKKSNNYLLFLKKRIFQKEWVELNYKKVLLYFSMVGFTLILLFMPLINGVFLDNFGKSLNLYFQKFEFNASLYYVFRWIGFQVTGYNLIRILGPVLAFLVFTGILFATLLEEKANWQKLFERMLFAICLYLFCTTTVHPWYVSLPVVFCLFTPFRFPILWSGLIFLTYINYSYEPYFENLWVVGMEYFLVTSFLIYELKNVKTSKVLKTLEV